MSTFWCNIKHEITDHWNTACARGSFPTGRTDSCQDCIAFKDHLTNQQDKVCTVKWDLAYPMVCSVYPGDTVYPDTLACSGKRGEGYILECGPCEYSSFISAEQAVVNPLEHYYDLVAAIEAERSSSMA